MVFLFTRFFRRCDRASHLLKDWGCDRALIQLSLISGQGAKLTQQRQHENPNKELRAIAYSMDALIPGFYAWFGSLRFRIGGSEAEETYPGTIHSFAGMVLVLSGYRIFSTYQGDYNLC